VEFLASVIGNAYLCFKISLTDGMDGLAIDKTSETT